MSLPSRDEYDVIFAGGGTAGCLAASRLASADPTLKILILEQGPHTNNIPAHTQPARFISHLVPSSKTVTFNAGVESKELAGRSLIVPSGRCLGGGSSVNFAMYTRGSTSDYDEWKTTYENPGWGSEELIPLFKKTETYQIRPDQPTHGYSGPLKVSYGGKYLEIAKEFLDVASKIDKRREMTEDMNDLCTCNKYGRWHMWVDEKTGTRSDVPHHFLYNQNFKNLEISVGKRVHRVIFEGDTAVGVEFTHDLQTAPDAETHTMYSVRASKLVVVSAGAFESPTILERSGIGAKDILERHHVPQVVDLPGVGENYQDHQVVFCPFEASEDAETLDAIYRGEEPDLKDALNQWYLDGKGLIAQNGIDAGIKMRPHDDELPALGDVFNARWNEHFKDVDSRPVVMLNAVASFIGDPSSVPPRKYFSISYCALHPASVGSVHINSGSDPHASPVFKDGYLTHPSDIVTLRWGYKQAREYARRMRSYRGEYVPGHPKFKEGSTASCSSVRSGSYSVDEPMIKYGSEEDEALDQFHREAVQTGWHSLGTCGMKPRGQGGVVDARLNVYGVRNLKVADMSIAPSNVSANTYSTALVIGEKVAVLIGEDLGIQGI